MNVYLCLFLLVKDEINSFLILSWNIGVMDLWKITFEDIFFTP